MAADVRSRRCNTLLLHHRPDVALGVELQHRARRALCRLQFLEPHTRVSALEAGETSGGFSGGGGPFAEIESFTIAGDFAYLINGTFTATLTNGQTIGPDAFPFPMWLSAGAWAPSTPYLVGNTFYIDGAVYGVIYPYPGAATSIQAPTTATVTTISRRRSSSIRAMYCRPAALPDNISARPATAIRRRLVHAPNL